MEQQHALCVGSGDVTTDIFSGEIPDITPDLDNQAESAIAKLMSALSSEAREKAYKDMHGVPDVAMESPELLQKGLGQLQFEIDNIIDKPAYNQALKQDPNYVCDEEFRTLFLRTDEMNPGLAALRIVRHFQLKLDLFGSECLTKTITQDDLDRDDMEALYAGRGRVLPSKDRAGRTLNLFIVGQPSSTQAMLRRSFYNIMSNPQATQGGIVTIIYGVGCQSVPNRAFSWKFPKIAEGLPVRISAVHMCQSKSLYSMAFAFVMMAFDAFTRIRIKTHSGTHDEVMASLRGYGIELERLPLNRDGKISDLEEYRQGLLLQRARERLQHPRRNRIHVPCMFDVLFGKGTPFQNHVGNKRFRLMVTEQQQRYTKSERGEKLQVAQDIVDNVIENSGVFLKPDGESWIAVENDAARAKVSATFRTMRRTNKRLQSSCKNLPSINNRLSLKKSGDNNEGYNMKDAFY
ncbi:unnamed protein product [Cylindrotheca closterium]|uniref:DUF6824 domain-containing protein n=1 Tax=Cylindrotheca closterium TaxID=2856 RepID=A0AAD2GDY0_9STRA|nr:unnamed protein product [Cylindrotheca closterium]